MAALEEGKHAAGLAAAARNVALKAAEATEERCRVAEAVLKALRDQLVAEARLCETREKLKAREDAVADRDNELVRSAREQAAERGHVEKLKEEVEAEKDRLKAKA